MTSEQSQVYVSVRDCNINNNNIQSKAPMEYYDVLNQQPYARLTKVDPCKKQCDMCFRDFDSWSILYTHKANPCWKDDSDSEPHPIMVLFDKSQLVFFGDCLQERGIEVFDNTDPQFQYKKYFLVDKRDFEILLRQLYVAQITKYNIEEWVPQLMELSDTRGDQEYTARSIFFELSDDDLETIRRFSSINLAENLGNPYRPTNEEQHKKEILIEKIDQWIRDNGSDGEKIYFCRLSTRSPKDGVSMKKGAPDEPLEERLTNKLNQLQVRNGDDIFSLIVKSQRVFSDIMNYFQYRTLNTTSGKINLILRDWIEQIPQDHEFRCYVKDRKLIAISQYHCYCKFEALQDIEHVFKIRQSIMDIHERTKDVFQVPSYVVDIVVLDDYSAQIIELNPYGAHMSSGSALYNWNEDYELLNGNLELDVPPIRILKQLIDSEKEGQGC
eukprot:TRINITY_DN6715_c0_g1_i1.p1 TRINITY_DN6715_c0_g1~~TRINITY_DN6715_c0_g1_i1.p1  ORF type:complete len:451 (-),score=69.09 TRINITY_DN6715_c0_g1_i1:17-1339(-)